MNQCNLQTPINIFQGRAMNQPSIRTPTNNFQGFQSSGKYHCTSIDQHNSYAY